MSKSHLFSVSQAKQKLNEVIDFVNNKNSTGGLRSFLAKAVAGTLGLKVANAALGYLTSLLLARFLGVKDYGVYAYSIAWIRLLRIPAMLGLAPLVVREIAVYRNQESWKLVRGLALWSNKAVLVTSITVALIAAFTVQYLLPNSSEQTIAVFQIAMIAVPLVAWRNIKQGLLQAFNHIVKAQLPELVLRPLVFLGLFCGAFFLLGKELTASWVMVMYCLATGVSCWVVILFLKQCLPSEIETNSQQYRSKEWVYAALPMLFIDGMYIINNQADIIMLGAITEPATVGIYTVANRAASLIIFILFAVNTAFAPTFASLYSSGDLERLQQVVTKGARLTFLAALPVAIGLIVFGHWFLLLFGSEFLVAKMPLTILCLGQLFNAFVGSVAVLLNMTGHQNDVAIGVSVSAGVNIILNVTLIPEFGAVGAALATTVSAAIWNILLIRSVRTKLRIHPTVLGKIRSNSQQ